MIDATLPHEVARSFLGRFSTLLGEPSRQLKVAVLRELSSLPSPHWPLVRAERAVDWLEPTEAARMLDELRDEELLVPVTGGNWRLSEEAQLVAAVCAVLSIQHLEPERLVRVLCAATSLALAAGTEDEPAIAPFLAALDVLDADFETLLALIDLGDVPALRSISKQARLHAADLATLLEREGDALEALQLTSSARAGLERAPTLAARVGALAAEVEATFGIRASDLPPGSIPIDQGILRRLVCTSDMRKLARLVRGHVPLPAAIGAGRAQRTEALAALESWLDQPEPDRAALPQPRHLDVEPIDVVPDFVLVAGEALRWLAGRQGGESLSKWVIGGTWSQAVTRMAAAVEAWSRWGPAGDGSLLASLEARPLIEPVEHDEIGVASATSVRGLAVGQPPEPSAALDQTGPSEPTAAEQPGESVPVAVLQVDNSAQPASQDPPAREEPTS